MDFINVYLRVTIFFAVLVLTCKVVGILSDKVVRKGDVCCIYEWKRSGQKWVKQVRVTQTNLRCLNVLTEDAFINYFQLTKGNLFYRLQDQTSLKITGVFPGEQITLKVKDSGYNSLNT